MTVVSDREPLRILFVSGIPLGAAACRYRCEHLAEALRKSGARADVVYIGQPRVRVAHDIVVLYRICATAEGRRFVRAARACGAVLVYSTDDVVFDADAAPPAMGGRFRALAPLHREILREADAAIASTEYLAQWMRRAAPETPVHVLRNFLGDALVNLGEDARNRAEKAAGDDRVTFGYLSGSPTHDQDLASIAPPLGSVLQANPRARLLVVGPVRLPDSLLTGEAAGQVRRMAPVAWTKLPGLIAAQGIDINLAPLELSRDFCQAKSEVKFLEAAALAIPTVASAARGFWEAIPGENGESGCFAAADSDEWEAALDFLVQQKQERIASGLRAYQQARISGTVKANADAVQAVFEALAGQERFAAPRAAYKTTTVNWPFSTKYVIKSAVERAAQLRSRAGNR